MHYLLFVGLLHIISADILWISTMTSSNYSDWIISNGYPNYLSNNGDCPSANPDECWEICNLDNDVDDYIYRIASTEGYQNITLTFNMALYLMDDAHEYCRLYYNLNDVGDNTWLPLYEFGDQGSQRNNFALQLSASVYNNAGFGIKIVPDANVLGCCLMSNVYVSGTSYPITVGPTTSSPTTSDPTTNKPTTYIPTTNIPSTNAPTTTFPTIAPITATPITSTSMMSPTYVPAISTLFPTKNEPLTTLEVIMENESESFVESDLFIILVVTVACIIVFLIVIILFMWFKKKRKDHTDIIKGNIQLSTTTIDDNTKNNIVNQESKVKKDNIKIKDNLEDTNNILSERDDGRLMNEEGDDDNEDMYNKTEQHVTTRGDESDSDLYEQMSTTTDGDMDKDTQMVHEGNNEYKMVQRLLKQCDSEWSEYLNMFKTHKITDTRLKHIPYDDDIWEILLPEIGVRYQFKDLCKAQYA